MKSYGAVCCFYISGRQLLWNSLDQLHLAFFSSGVAGVNLRKKGSLRTHFAVDGERGQWPLRISFNKLTNRVFRALRSILNGFVAFFTACNRHRLSIYNHMKEFNHRLSRAARRTHFEKNSQSGQTSGAQVTPRGRKESHHEAKTTKIR
ncbi:hypothetical protein CDL12_30189 [Handroanthus impetiginosus]|uniref:Uncharacterized protein n=1 Tax=Handroanthus impetiginosus TaxID=429701 RepID=A0A2G9FWN5_9LAMI|nr:hypothetical protein CDL12_30189 [Handroanthus impetiginosus]